MQKKREEKDLRVIVTASGFRGTLVVSSLTRTACYLHIHSGCVLHL